MAILALLLVFFFSIEVQALKGGLIGQLTKCFKGFNGVIDEMGNMTTIGFLNQQ
jgi:hypothetical protein